MGPLASPLGAAEMRSEVPISSLTLPFSQFLHMQLFLRKKVHCRSEHSGGLGGVLHENREYKSERMKVEFNIKYMLWYLEEYLFSIFFIFLKHQV